MSMDDLFQALNMFNQGVSQLATGRAIRGASEQAQTINMNEQDEFKKRQQLTQLGTGLAAQLSSYGANPSQIQQSVGSFMPQQLNNAGDFFTASQVATSPESKKQLASAGSSLQSQEASAPLTTFQKSQLELERDKMNLSKKSLQAEAQQKLGEQGLKISDDLFTKWTNNQVTKDSQVVAIQYQKMKTGAASDSAAGDMSMIFGFMKMLDANSSVKEGEYATAEQAGPVAGRYLNLYNKAISGQKLTAAQRRDFLKNSGSLYQAQLMQQKRFDNTLKRRASDLGIDPSKVTLGETLFGDDYSLDTNKKEQKAPPASLNPAAPSTQGVNILDFIK